MQDRSYPAANQFITYVLMGIRKFSTPINFVLFQLCWFGCVLGAAHQLEWLGPLLVLVTIPLQIYWLTDKYRAEAYFIVLCGMCGFFLETLLIMGGVYVPTGSGGLRICPPWMIALWVNFGMLVSLSLSWLKSRYLLATILGALAGPLAWWGGEKLGALTVAAEFNRGYLPLGLVWAVVLPILLHVHAKLLTAK